MQVVVISARQDSHVSRHDCRYVRRGTFLRAPGVARLGFSAMVVANLECDVPGISPGLVTDLGIGSPMGVQGLSALRSSLRFETAGLNTLWVFDPIVNERQLPASKGDTQEDSLGVGTSA